MNPFRNNRLSKFVSCVLSASLVNMSIPYAALAPVMKRPDTGARALESRPLTEQELEQFRGRSGRNPYNAGSSKMAVVHKGVDVLTGNFSLSATDLSFEGGYGVPINVTRSYSSNGDDEGPLGRGWTLSVDIRTTAGGLLKSAGAPVRSTPVTLRERPVGQDDPHNPNEPVEAVIATDAQGFEETIQKDVDGVLTTPPWDKNENDAEYEFVGGQWILVRNIVRTPEGTIYVYEKKGSFPYGTRRYDEPQAQPSGHSNILKIVSVTDRHGNQTLYHYGTGLVNFAKSNGTAVENPLTQIVMPNGHTINFAWTGNRITSATDGTRTVTYGYTGGYLTSVTSPGGKTTSYGYGSAATPPNWGVRPVAGDVLVSVTDPRGLTTTMSYMMANAILAPYNVVYGEAPYCYAVTSPNGTYSRFRNEQVWLPGDPGPSVGAPTLADYDSTGALLAMYETVWIPSQVEPIVSVYLRCLLPVRPGATPRPIWEKHYNAYTQDLLAQVNFIHPDSLNYDPATRRLGESAMLQQSVRTDTAYNFMGNPLRKQVTEHTVPRPGFSAPADRVTTINYAYHGKDRYYQQKAVKDNAGRVSYTDYYTDEAAQGSKGQVYRVYDPKHATFVNATASDWKYTIAPAPGTTHSAEFAYDSNGRPTDVWKLQKTGPDVYVRTQTVYGPDQSPWWGAPSSVTEDAGGINRITQTLAYDSIGRATLVQDAKGQQFQTVYDLDGQIQSVSRVDVAQPVVSYSYGSAGILNGVPLSVTDHLSGVVQTFGYSATPGGSLGQVVSVTEQNGSTAYTVGYTYNSNGERDTATYTTPTGTVRWRYADYSSVGDPLGGQRVFRTLNKLDGNGARTAEEFQYHFDSSGRLTEATFAMSPRTDTGAPTSPPYYTSNYPYLSRGRAHYEYDPAGRLLKLKHWWEEFDQTSQQYLASEPVLGNQRLYDAVKGLCVQSDFYVKSGMNWALERSETYSYDADLDYLTSASYGDGLPNWTITWGYDAAGNRISDSSQPGTWTYDNLNRMTASPGRTYTNDILGNRLSKSGAASYGWDALNRMVSLDTTHEYLYRADGMRVRKTISGSGVSYVDSFYDGQMPIEEHAHRNGLTTSISRNGVGARGIDMASTIEGAQAADAYPLYDAHGNNVATLTKGSGSTYIVGNRRSYDAWGAVRSGSTAGKAKYVANLGHVEDEESGLVYMRARFYEPSSGRFVSEDPELAGRNWFNYASLDPVNRADLSGRIDGSLADIVELLNKWLARTTGYEVHPGLKSTELILAAAAELKLLWSGAAYLDGLSSASFALGAGFATSGAVPVSAAFMALAGLARIGSAGLRLATLFVLYDLYCSLELAWGAEE